MMRLEPGRIPSGDLELSALCYLPELPLRTTALLYAHGFTSGKYSLDGLASYLAGRGYSGLTFDAIGHKLGGTGGSMESIRQAADNLQDALVWLQESLRSSKSEVKRVVIVGHSMGGAAALVVAAQEQRRLRDIKMTEAVPSLAGIVCVCIGTDPFRGFSSAIGKAMLSQRQDYVAGTPAGQLLHELDTLVLEAKNVGDMPALFIAAKQDVLLPVERVEALAAMVGSHAKIASIDSSHLKAPDKSRGTILNWLSEQGW